jgi:tape measure domain-containing protein
MAEAGGTIKIGLTLNSKDFVIEVKNADRLLAQFQKRFDSTGASVKKIENHFSSFATKLRHTVQFLGAARFALMDIDDVFLALPTSIAKTSGEFERMQKLLEGLSKETSDFARKAEGLRDVNFALGMAKSAPFEIKAITDAMVKFKSAGLDPANGSMQALLNSVASFGGTSDTLHRASIAIQQMMGKGVISMEELRQQLGEAVPTAIRQMADASGISIAKLVENISKGVVESKQALTLMFAEMRRTSSGAALSMMQTWIGTLQVLKTEWELFKKVVGDSGFLDASREAMQEVVDLLRTAEARQAAAQFGAILKTITLALIDMSRAARENWNVITSLTGALVTFVAARKLIPLIAGITSAISLLGTTSKTVSAGIIVNQAATDAAYSASAAKQIGQMRLLVTEKRRLAALERATDTLRAMSFNGANAVIITGMNAKADAIRRNIALRKLDIGSQLQWAGVLRGFGRVAGFITGPLGWIAVALTTGISLWAMWGDSAADAYRKIQESANNGLSTSKDLEKVSERIAESRKKIAALRLELATEESVVPGRFRSASSEAQRKKRAEDLRAGIKTEEDAIIDATRTKHRAEINLQRDAVNEQIRQFQVESEERERQIGTRFANERQLYEENFRKTTKLKGEPLEAAIATYRREAGLRQTQAVIASYRADEARLKTEIEQGGAGVGALKEQLLRVFERREQLERDIRAGREGLTLNNADKNKKGSTGTSPVLNPFEGVLARAEADLAAARKTNEYLLQAEGTVRTQASIRDRIEAEIDSQVTSGVWDREGKDGKKTGPSANDIAKLKNARTETEILNQQKSVLDDLVAKQLTLSQTEEDSLSDMQVGKINNKTEAYRALERSFITLRAQTELTEAGVIKFDAAQQKALASQANIDANLFVGQFAGKAAEIRASIADNDRDARTQEYSLEVEHLTKTFNARLNALVQGEQTEEEFLERKKALNDQFYEYIQALAEKHARNMETPMQKLARDWKDVTGQMRDASTGWANQTVDSIIQMAKTGKFEVGQMVESILTDIARIQLQRSLASPLSNLLDKALPMLVNIAGGGKLGAPVDASYGLAQDDIDGPRFANGGIMSRFGSMALSRYARGGIANSPQLAMFGEGSTPEAYVPLPDGRAIPVKMEGGMGAVTVNVINQSGTRVNADQSAPRFDGRQMVLDIVLTAATTAGPFRDGMKQAVGG